MSGMESLMTGKLGMRAVLAVIATTLVMLPMSAGEAWGAFGDEFGIAPINGHPNPHPNGSEDVPALPGADRAFWAGVCDRASAPSPGEEIEGGIGTRPSEILAPDRFPTGTQYASLAPAPEVLEHCIDPGAPESHGASSGRVWRASPYCSEGLCPVLVAPVVSSTGTFAPAWRLAPVTQAGAHPDGSTLMALARSASNRLDGQPDNIMVDLPPGFVGNPNAVPKCTAAQFASLPLACPPQSQIGILRLNIVGVGFGGSNLGVNDETAYPLYNLEPRQGNVAEIGFGYASGEHLTTVRLVGKARTNGDFGVTAFAAQIPAALPLINQSITLWGVPWERANDVWRSKLGHFHDSACNKTPGRQAPEYIPPTGLAPECRASYDPSWGPTPVERVVRPFLTNETDCNPAPVARLVMDSFQNPGGLTADGDPAIAEYPAVEDEDAVDGSVENPTRWETYGSTAPAVTGCAGLPFAPDIDFTPTSSAADSATGLNVKLSVPQNNDPKGAGGGPLDPPAPGADQGSIDSYVDAATSFWKSAEGRATAHLKDTVVKLPAGMSVNPSAAAGLAGCGDGQIGVRGSDSSTGRMLFNNGDPFDDDATDGTECPQGSIIGAARVKTPLLDEELTGQVVLGQPKSTNPASGEMFRLFLVVRNVERGLIAKIYGSTVADPETGQLTTTFLNNPELPFDALQLDVTGGDRGLLAQPQRCGGHDWTSAFVPWSAAHGAGGGQVDDTGALTTSSGCGFGFSPALAAGTSPRAGRASGARFDFAFTRQDGEQWLRNLTAKLPKGLLASVRGVPLCSNGQANAGACPAGSRIGFVDAGAGSGTPFFLERKGDVYLTEGYRGAPYGLAVVVPVEAGPFRGDLALSPIIVRQALQVDRRTAEVTAVSDPFPLIHHGIPLRVRHVAVTVDRPGFMLNPSGCAPKQIAAAIGSAQGNTANTTVPFQASGCGRLGFKPRLKLRLTGRKQIRTGKHPGVRAQVTQKGVSEAGIELAKVTLPKSLALDPDNAQALCEFAEGTKPDLENHCPRGSIVGRVRAVSPLLDRPLTGNVYFVKNVRTDPKTGNQIRTLPMIIAALRGEIAVNLYGESATTKSGRLVNTFNNVPDAPITRFNLNLKGGKNGILAVTRTRRAKINLCKGRQTAATRFHAHNNKNHNPSIKIKTPCNKKKTSSKKNSKKRNKRRR